MVTKNNLLLDPHNVDSSTMKQITPKSNISKTEPEDPNKIKLNAYLEIDKYSLLSYMVEQIQPNRAYTVADLQKMIVEFTQNTRIEKPYIEKAFFTDGRLYIKSAELLLMKQSATKIELDMSDSFTALVNKGTTRLGQRKWDIFFKFATTPYISLSYIGKEQGISRERVRQIVKMVSDTLILTDYYNQLNAHVTSLFNDTSILPKDDLLKGLNTNYDFRPEEVKNLLLILNFLYKTSYTDNGEYTLNFTIEQLHTTFKEEIYNKMFDVVRILRQGELLSTLNAHGFKVSKQTLPVLLSFAPKMLQNKRLGLYGLKQNITKEDICLFILYCHGSPLHYSEINRKYSKLTGQPQTERNTLATLDRSGKIGVVRTFAGTYGLSQLGATEMGYVVDNIYQVLSKSNRPLTVKEISDEVVRIYGCKPKSVQAFLVTSDKFHSVGKGMYVLATEENILRYPKKVKEPKKVKTYPNGLRHSNGITLYKPHKATFLNKRYPIVEWSDILLAPIKLLIKHGGVDSVRTKLLKLENYKSARFFATHQEALEAFNNQSGYRVMLITEGLYVCVASNNRGYYYASMRVLEHFGLPKSAIQYTYLDS